MSSIKQKDLKKLQEIQEKQGETILANVPQKVFDEAFKGVSEDIQKARLFLEKAKEEKERVNQAKVACAVIREAKKIMGKLNPEYAELLEEVKKLEKECNTATEIVAGVTVGKVSKKSQIRKNLENAKKGIAYIDKAVGDSLAKKYGFETALQVENLVKFSEE